MAIGLIIALLVSGGAAFAAEGSLPGDTLYPVKVGVNEEVRALVSFREEARADWAARRAERRLEEAEKLAVEGRFDAAARADIESRFERHAEAFEERAARIAERQGARGAFEAHSNFEASLTAHEHILARIAAEEEGASGEVEQVLAKVRSRMSAAMEARARTHAEVAVETGVEVRVAAEGKLTAAENKVAEVRGFLERMKASASAEVYAEAEARLADAEAVIARGKTEMEAEAYGEAFASFHEAIHVAQQAKLILRTEDRLNIRLMMPVFDAEIGPSGRGMMESETRMEIREDGSTRMESEDGAGTRGGVEVNVEAGAAMESDEEDGTMMEAGGEGRIKVDVGL